MATIEYSPTLHSTCLVLDSEESKTILPLVLKELARAREKWDHYQGLIDGGYATRKEETLCMKYEESFRTLNSIAKEIRHLYNH